MSALSDYEILRDVEWQDAVLESGHVRVLDADHRTVLIASVDAAHELCRGLVGPTGSRQVTYHWLGGGSR